MGPVASTVWKEHNPLDGIGLTPIRKKRCKPRLQITFASPAICVPLANLTAFYDVGVTHSGEKFRIEVNATG